MKEEIENIIDYLYGMRRDIEIFKKQHKDDDDKEYRKLCDKLLDRIKYVIENAERRLEEILKEEGSKND